MSHPALVDLAQKLALVREPWSPKILARVNDCAVKLVRFEGEFVWHAHADEDELFLVLEGRLEMRFRDGAVELGPGQLIVVPRGVEHLPVAPAACAALLFEPCTTVNTGDAGGPRTQIELESI